MNSNPKKLAAFRLSKDVRDLLAKLAAKTNKDKTQLIEEAIRLHAKELR